MSGITDVAKKLGIKADVIEEIFEEILALVISGERVRVKGFGTFFAKTYPGRSLTSPKVNDGKPIEFKDSMVLKFKQSQIAKQRLNQMAEKRSKAKKPAAKAKPKK